MTEVRLSVLIPTYNYADTIEEALNSVLEQQCPGTEIIVADDGSQDRSEELLRPWADDGRIRYFRQRNAGPASARNLALAHARGELLMFLDADDTLRPGCLAKTIDFFDRHPDVGLFFTNYDIFDSDGVITPSGVDGWKIFRQIPHELDDRGGWLFLESLTPWIIGHGAFMHTSGLTLRRTVAETIGPFRTGYCYGEDDEYYARAAHRTRAGYLDEVLSRKRNHARSVIHDHGNRLRNLRHLLELTEIQAREYAGDLALRTILRQKLQRCAEETIWLSAQRGERAQARALLARYWRRFPANPMFYRLGLKLLAKR